jgi:hypothetical protein
MATRSEELLEAGIPAGFDLDEPQPIDVPADFTPATGQVRYMAGDEWDPAALSVEERARLQRLMDDIGLIPKGAKYRLGVWDNTSRNAFRTLLGFANAEGVEWMDAMDLWAARPEVGAETEEFQPDPWMRPDPAALLQDVEDYIEQRLGRKADDTERRFLADAMAGLDRQQHDHQQAQARLAHQLEEDGQPVPEVFDGFDAAARFRDLFESRYADELAMREGVEAQVNATNNFMSNVFALDQGMGL